MGYQTRYHLEIDGNSNDIEQLKVEHSYTKNILAEDYHFGQLLKYDEHEAKWYGHEIYFISISKRFPFLLFKLYGIGEEWGDFWIKQFKDGIIKKHECILLAIQTESE